MITKTVKDSDNRTRTHQFTIMTKKSKGKPPVKKTKTSFFSKRASVPPPRTRSVNFEGAEAVTYGAVPITDSEDNNAESGRGAPPSASKSKKSKKSKKEKQVKKKSKRRVRNDSDDDDDSITLERKVKMKAIS